MSAKGGRHECHPAAIAFVVPVDDEHAEMLAYALSAEGQEKIATAQAEIDAGEGLVADDAYFESLRERRSQRRAPD
jgi:hypothetical protein